MKKISALIFIALFLVGAGTMKIRESAVSGKFYSSNSEKLSKAVDILINEAVPVKGLKPSGLILPHAGYAFSAQIAADGFRQAASSNYDTIIILGTNHTISPANKLFFYDGDAFRIPLGLLFIDKEFQKELMSKLNGSEFNNGAHQNEHSIEVQLPFIKKLFGDAKIIPMVVGSSDPQFAEEAGKTLGQMIVGKNVLVIASSDLSHYPDYETARKADIESLRSILTMDVKTMSAAFKKCETYAGVQTSACGAGPVMVLVSAMKEIQTERAAVLSYANSGDTVMGESSKVVGYGAVMFSKGAKAVDSAALELKLENRGGELKEAGKQELLKIARRAIKDYMDGEILTLTRTADPALARKQGAFVTLTKGGELRGCIGNMAEDTPLALTVAKMALSAAYDDQRFSPLQYDELKEVEIEISVLTPLKTVPGAEAIVVGRDGAVIEKAGRRAVFLPQVATEQGWTKEQMLENLCRKAGLPGDCYKDGCKFSTFQAIVFKEKK